MTNSKTKSFWKKYCEHRKIDSPETAKYYNLYLVSKRLDSKRKIAFLEDFKERYLKKGFDLEMTKHMVGEIDCQVRYFEHEAKELSESIDKLKV